MVMEREELINVIRKAVSSKKLIFPSEMVEIGQYRPVYAVSKKFVYMACLCYIDWKYENGVTIKKPYKLPLYKVYKDETSTKLDLDCLDKEDLERIFEGIKKYLITERDSNLPTLKAKLKECEENVNRLKAIKDYI